MFVQVYQEHYAYQLSLPSYEPVASDNGALGSHSHTVTATGNKEMSMFVVCGDWSLGSHQGTTLVYARGHHAAEELKEQ